MIANRKIRGELITFVLLKAMFDCSFTFFSAKAYEYVGMILSFNLIKYIIGWAVCLMFIYCIVKGFQTGTISIITKSLFVLSGLPNLAIYGLFGGSDAAFILMCLYWMILIFLLRGSVKIENKINADSNDEISILPSWEFALVLFIFGGLCTVYFFSKYGFGKVFISFYDTYVYRSAYAEMSKSMISSYLINWLGIIIIPYCFASFLINRKIILTILAGICGLLLYGIGAEKSVLLVYPLIIIVYILYKNGNISNFFSLFCWGIIGYGCLGLGLFFLFHYLPAQNVFQRLFTVTTQINYYYYDYVSTHELLLLRDSIMRWLAASPYPEGLEYIIGEMGMGGQANTGLFGDAYANFGVVGVVVYPFLMCAVANVLRRVFSTIDKRFVAVMIINLVLGCLSVSLFTWLLTGGVFICMLLVMVDKKLFRHRLVRKGAPLHRLRIVLRHSICNTLGDS